MTTVVLTLKQRWLVRLLCNKGIIGAAALWLCVKCLPFKWLFKVGADPVE